MEGKIILNLAISLDGYIADEDGGFDWIAGQKDNRLDTENELLFSEFLKGIDVVVMGKKSYLQGKDSYVRDYADKVVYVATNEIREDTENIRFIGGDVVDTIVKERGKGKAVYLFGGGVLIDPFVKANVIDEYIIGIIPIILGKGRPLLLGNNPTIPLHLQDYSLRDGTVVMRYTKRLT